VKGGDNMKATFEDFLAQNPNCSKFDGNPDAIAIFNLLSKDENIIGMIDASEAGKPALSACVNEIEAYFDSQQNSMVDLTDNFTRTAVGRMVKTIIAPFGYEVTVQKDLPKASKSKYFTSASCYAKTGIATMKVIRTITAV
jgi:hypothetical protein